MLLVVRSLFRLMESDVGSVPNRRSPDNTPHPLVRELACVVLASYAGARMIPNPHDALFKVVLGKPEHARGMLRAVVPPVLAEALDWQTLTLRPGSFVDAALKHQHTDLLYAATWRDGGEALVYLLFEHQSTPPTEGLMVYRLLRYQDRIWEHWRADHPKAKTLVWV